MRISIVLATIFMLIGSGLVLSCPFLYEEIEDNADLSLSWGPTRIFDEERAIRNGTIGVGLFALGVTLAFMEPKRKHASHLVDEIHIPNEGNRT